MLATCSGDQPDLGDSSSAEVAIPGAPLPSEDGTRTGRPGAIRLWSGARPPPTISGWREAVTRGPDTRRRDRAEPLARPTRA
jgi:hypothetical protein